VIAKQGEIVFRVFASNGSGGVSVVIDTIEAALGKVSEFRAEGSLARREGCLAAHRVEF
jgi:hypothetical protein